jgi:acetolactate synthase-1/2/3 large subunit
MSFHDSNRVPPFRSGPSVFMPLLLVGQNKRAEPFRQGSLGVTRPGTIDFPTIRAPQTPFVGMIGNNSSWDQIRFGQERKYPGRGDIGNVVGDVRFDHLAKAMGGFGIRVTKPEDIRPALEKARDSAKPAPADVIINRDVYSSGTSNQTMYK